MTVTSVQQDTTYQYDGLSVSGINGVAAPAAAMLVYSGAQALADGTRATLSAQLSAIDSTPISGARVTLTLGGRAAQSCRGVSDSSFLPATTTGHVIVFAYTQGGTYVAVLTG